MQLFIFNKFNIIIIFFKILFKLIRFDIFKKKIKINIFNKKNKILACLNCHSNYYNLSNFFKIPIITKQKIGYIKNSIISYIFFIRKSFIMNFISINLLNEFYKR